MAVLARFGSAGFTVTVPFALSPPPPAPAYHSGFDRGISSGPYPWSATQANGSISGTDFFAVLVQFGHDCS
jgi:hypothetical protein